MAFIYGLPAHLDEPEPLLATAGSSRLYTDDNQGTNFVSGAKVRWNGSDRVTTFVSATQLQASILAADIAATGTIPVTVRNPDGSVSNTMSFDVRVPVSAPTVTGLSPSVATAGAAAFTLTVTGTNFVSGAKVRWNGSDRVTTFVSATQLQASILAADIAATGTIPVTVRNPDGGVSNTMSFDVRVPVSAPTVTGLSPSVATAGAAAFTLTVTGTNFVSGAKVRWNGSDRVTTFVSATQLQASILAADIATAGTISVTVLNPDGSVSNTMSLEVRVAVPVPAPAVTGLSPSVATAGAAAFTLTVTGTNFVSGAKVRWNGADRATTFGSATQLQASITTADISMVGSVPVTVLNPDGELSNAMTFEVRVPPAAYTDDFNRANESPLKGNWAAWDFGLGSLELYNNQLRSTDTNPYNVWARRPYEPYSADHYSQMKLTSSPSKEVGGPAVRVQLNGPEINGYIFTVVNSTTAAIWVRYSSVPDTWQQVGTNFTGTFASGDVYKLAIKGNVLTVYRNGVSLGARTDTNNRIPSGGSAGMSIVNPGTWDDWQGGGASDSSPPFVISQSPPSGAMGVPKSNRLLSFHVADGGTGINSSDISAIIAGTAYTCSSGLSCTGSPNDITVTYVNASDWTENQLIDVSVNARDIAGNIMPTVSYTFRIGSWALAWSDEFDDAGCTTQNPCAPDMTKWIYEVNHATYDNKMATDNNHYYKTRSGVGWTGGWATDRLENVRVEDGTLVIEVRNDNYQGHGVTTGRLRTAGGYPDITQDPWVVKKQWKNGRLEARIKYDQSLGTWTAFWTGGVGPDIWPESGEIDILETYGFQPRVAQGGAWAKSADGSDHFVAYSYTMPDDPGTNWHTYSVEVSPGKLDYYFDFQLMRTVTSSELTVWPYDTHPQDIRIWYEFANMGEQGTNPSALSKRMTVDYVRYYTLGVIAPIVTGLSPSFATAGGSAFPLTVNGSNFLSGAKVRWNGTDRATTFVSATQLQAAILAADIATTRTISLIVLNPDGGISDTMGFEVRAPVSAPTVTGLNPSFATAGGAAFTLTVTGTNFISGAKVRWNGSDRVTAIVSASQLQAGILAADIAKAGTIPVTVLNPDGNLSNAVTFEVRVLSPAVADINPSVATAGAPAFTLTVYGSNFVSGAKVRWNGADRTTTFVSVTQLQASIPAADVATPGMIPVTVLNPDGGSSNAMNFTVWGPAPTVTGLSRSYATAGGTAFTLTVYGNSFASGAKVRWNGSDRVTTFVAATQLQAAILAADIATVGTIPVTVLNPDGGVSNGFGFDILPGLVSSTITPATVVGGNSSTGTVTLNGPAPTGGSVVSLSSSNISVANVPATVTVLSGNTSATFTIATTPVSTSTSVTISALYGGVNRSSTLTVNRPALMSISSSPATIVGGNTSTGTVTLSGPAPGGGVVVSLSSSNTSVARVPANATVPAGNTSANFTITTSAVTSSRSVTISANYGGVRRSTTLSVRR